MFNGIPCLNKSEYWRLRGGVRVCMASSRVIAVSENIPLVSPNCTATDDIEERPRAAAAFCFWVFGG
jgi:hypothetical protein